MQGFEILSRIKTFYTTDKKYLYDHVYNKWMSFWGEDIEYYV